MTACKICEAPDAKLLVQSHYPICQKCAAYPVLVYAFSEGTARRSGSEIVLVPKHDAATQHGQ